MPIYFLAGEEPYYIDELTEALEKNVLTEDEKAFNQTIVYGQDVDMEQLISLAKQYPMGAEKQLIIVKEAQHLAREIDKLLPYAENPQSSTVLVFNFKGKTIDKRLKIAKTLQKLNAYHEFKKIYESKIPDWIDQRVLKSGVKIDMKAKMLLAEFVGANLSRLDSEIEKLALIIGKGNTITPDQIERNIGISKDYNNFELRTAIINKDMPKIASIIHYFDKNPKENPIIVTISAIFNLFQSLVILHTLEDKSPSNAAKNLGVHPYFVNEYFTGAKNYPLKSTMQIISLIREYDMKSKGVGATGNVSHADLLKELAIKIIHS